MNKLLIPISSSFVKNRLKLNEDKGSGESKLFVGSKKKEQEYDSFFRNFDSTNKYCFSKDNLIDYLKMTKIEYIAQKCNKYKNIDLEYYEEKMNFVESLDDNIFFEAIKFVDNARYYIRPEKVDQKLFDSILREIALPKISNLEITREDETFKFNLCLNYEAIINRNSNEENSIQTSKNVDKPHQRIFFGAPGTGKSYELNKEAQEYFGDEYERVTFHPNYMYGNFVGAYKPFPKILKNKDGSIKTDSDGNIQETITYEYIPGVLMKQLVKALENPNRNYLLLIEEINRANVAAVFGDIFQLLDRNEMGESEYFIATSKELQEYLVKTFKDVELSEEVNKKLKKDFSRLYLPNNLYIWATMNSADQGVMPMDTAFRRRWEFKYLGINDAADANKEDFANYKFKINSTETVKWDEFRRELNRKLSSLNIPEDKLIGPYFISKSILEGTDLDRLTETIKNKVLMYLYEDAAKAFRSSLFAEGKYSTYSDVCNYFDENALSLFKGNLEVETEEISLNEKEADKENQISEE